MDGSESQKGINGSKLKGPFVSKKRSCWGLLHLHRGSQLGSTLDGGFHKCSEGHILERRVV